MNMQGLITRSGEVADLLKAMSNANRLMILCELHKGERTVTALEAVVPLSQSALSQHLAKLREVGIVTTRREAQTIHYSIADQRIVRVMGTLYQVFCSPTVRPRKNKKESSR